MDEVTALYRELDPLRPLGGDEDALYVDWQKLLDPDGRDVRSRLVQTFRRNATPQRPIVRLLTGHRGSGKTTELNRVRDALESDHDSTGKKLFVSTLAAEKWLDLEDLHAEDLVFQIVRQLVTDLRDSGMRLSPWALRGFFGSLWDRPKSARLDSVDVGADPLAFSFALAEPSSTARTEFRAALRAQLPSVFDLVNRELLPQAREHLERGGYDDILIIVDGLDKMPTRSLAEDSVTEQTRLFVDQSSLLRAIACSLLLTVPIELAFSPMGARLRDVYGTSINAVPIVPVADRAGTPITVAEDALIAVIGKRARRALDRGSDDPTICARQVFDGEEPLRQVVRLSGGHLRSLLVIVSELLGFVDALPIPASIVDRHVTSERRNLMTRLHMSDRDMLAQVARDGQPLDDPRFFAFLQSGHVIAYQTEQDHWYGLNPLLRELA